MKKKKCLRCSQDFQPPDVKTNVCANCADELRAEEDAYFEQAKVADEKDAYFEQAKVADEKDA